MPSESKAAVENDIRNLPQMPEIGNEIKNPRHFPEGSRYIKVYNVDRALYPSGIRVIYRFSIDEISNIGVLRIIRIGTHDTNVFGDER